MSITERLKKRTLFSATVKVSVPKEDPEFILEIARMPDAELTCAAMGAHAYIESTGMNESTDPNIRNLAYVIAIAPYLKRHVKSWEHKPKEGEVLLFSKPNLDNLFSVLSVVDLSFLVAQYNEALNSDEKKTQS